MLGRWMESLLRPRWALASMSVALALGLTAGVWQGQSHAKAIARARYVAAVAPWHVQ